ncbi:hypothetical protein MJO29_014470 [Puccinia striiformis f. sp. tritici]|nr:hypothetical protein MJO29_014470 [Puccinia striiformis f. sp. tritici]
MLKILIRDKTSAVSPAGVDPNVTLTPVNVVPSPKGPVLLKVDPNGKIVMVASLGKGDHSIVSKMGYQSSSCSARRTISTYAWRAGHETKEDGNQPALSPHID